MNDVSGRSALLHATIRVVGQGGLSALTYRAVAADAGVSHGLVRHHFGSRDKLIVDAMDLAIEESLKGSNMLKVGLSVDEFAEGIATLAARDTDVQSFQYELLLETRRRPDLQPAADKHYTAYREAIAQQLSRFGIDDPGLTDVIWFTLDGIVFKQLILPGDVEPALARLRSIIKAALPG